MIVAVGTKNPAKLEGVKKAFARFFPGVELRPINASAVAKAQPIGLDQMTSGAIARARYALSMVEADFGVGVEAGIFTIGEVYFDHQQAAVVGPSGKASLGHSAGYMLPRKAMEALIRDGKELERWAEELSGIDQVGDKGGLIRYLTDGEMNRAELTEQCVITALVPWLHKDVYGF